MLKPDNVVPKQASCAADGKTQQRPQARRWNALQEAEAGSQALVAAQECELARLERETAQQRAFMQARITETQVSCS